MFVGDLCQALGRTLADVFAMSAAEFAFWACYVRKRGLTADRLEAATAISGAYTGHVWGGRAEARDLLPHFGPRQTNMKLLAAQLSALPGAKVRRIPRPDRKPKAESDPQPAPKSRVLNPRK